MQSFSMATLKKGLTFALAAGFIVVPSVLGAVTLYAGQSKEQAGIILNGWGTGSSAESADKRFNGEKSIKVTTQGLYAGGCIEFTNPVELPAGDKNSKDYLQFALNFVNMINLNPAGFTYGQAYGGYDYGSTSDLIRIPKVSKMRIVFVSTSGKSVEVQVPVTSSDEDEGWPRINVPLAALKSPDGGNTINLKKILVFTDIPETLYIGEISTLTDDTPLSCSVTSNGGDDPVVASNDVVFFRATAEGGASTLLYSWDFNATDGIQEDAGGPVVLHVYKKAGNYKATLTVRDAFGIKPPATATINVEVND